jgi:heptosyltransferase-3
VALWRCGILLQATPSVANVAAKRLPDFIPPQGRRLLRKKQVKFGVEMPKGERGNRVLRNLDKLVGVPILLLLGLLSQVRVRRRRPEKATRIGLLMLGVIGDSLLASAIADDLKQRYPGAVVTGFMTDANRATSEILSGIDEYIFLSITDPLEAMRTVRKHPLDILIDFNQWARIGALLSFVSRSKFTVGFKTSGQYRHFLYDACATHRGDQHELENFRDLARCLAINPAGMPKLRSELKDIPVPQLPQIPYIVFHPWASGYRHELREWSLEKWTELGRAVIREGYYVVISGGPSDREQSLSLAASIGEHTLVLAGDASLPQTIAALARAAAVVAVNTGTMHLVAALDIPLVALHGPTDPARWGPLSSKADVLGPGKGEGGAYLNLGFEYPRAAADCMSKIATADVLTSLRKVLSNVDKFDAVRGQVISRR